MIDIAHIETTKPVSDTTSNVHIGEPLDEDTTTTIEIEVDAIKNNDKLYTRFTDPWKKERVEEILKQVQIGPDLTEDECRRVREFLTEWADGVGRHLRAVSQ